MILGPVVIKQHPPPSFCLPSASFETFLDPRLTCRIKESVSVKEIKVMSLRPLKIETSPSGDVVVFMLDFNRVFCRKKFRL